MNSLQKKSKRPLKGSSKSTFEHSKFKRFALQNKRLFINISDNIYKNVDGDGNCFFYSYLYQETPATYNILGGDEKDMTEIINQMANPFRKQIFDKATLISKNPNYFENSSPPFSQENLQIIIPAIFKDAFNREGVNGARTLEIYKKRKTWLDILSLYCFSEIVEKIIIIFDIDRNTLNVIIPKDIDLHINEFHDLQIPIQDFLNIYPLFSMNVSEHGEKNYNFFIRINSNHFMSFENEDITKNTFLHDHLLKFIQTNIYNQMIRRDQGFRSLQYSINFDELIEAFNGNHEESNHNQESNNNEELDYEKTFIIMNRVFKIYKKLNSINNNLFGKDINGEQFNAFLEYIIENIDSYLSDSTTTKTNKKHIHTYTQEIIKALDFDSSPNYLEYFNGNGSFNYTSFYSLLKEVISF